MTIEDSVEMLGVELRTEILAHRESVVNASRGNCAHRKVKKSEKLEDKLQLQQVRTRHRSLCFGKCTVLAFHHGHTG